MVELVVVVAILAILAGLLVMGVGKLHTTAKRQQTMQTFQNLQAMFADWDAVTHVPFSSWTMPSPMNVTLDANPPAGMSASAMAADDTKAPNRYGAVVWLTRDLMFNLKSVPNNAAALAKMPADEVMTLPTNYDGVNGIPTGFAAPTQWTSAVPTTYNPVTISATSYLFTRIYLPDPTTPTTYVYYDCIQSNQSASSNMPPNNNYWLPAYPTFSASGATPTDNSIPVLLDGWGNPIIFVPGGQLGSGQALGSGNTVTPGSGALVVGGVTSTIRSPDGRPFFASAGPDGDFSQGDDNLYSFEH